MEDITQMEKEITPYVASCAGMNVPKEAEMPTLYFA
jgi:hypothetical protein